MIQCSVTGEFFSEFFGSGLHGGDLEPAASHEELLPRDSRKSRGLGLGDHARFVPLQGRSKSQFASELGGRQAQCAERGFRYVHFDMHAAPLAQKGPAVTGIYGMIQGVAGVAGGVHERAEFRWGKS